MVILATTTGALAFLTGPALTAFLSGGRQSFSSFPSWAHDVFGPSTGSAWWSLPAAIVVLAAVKGLSYLGQFYFAGLWGQRVSMSLRRALFQHFSKLALHSKWKNMSGDLLSRFSTELPALESAASTALTSYVRDGLSVLVLLGVALYSNGKSAALALILLPLAILPVRKLTKSFSRKTSEGLRRLGAMSGQVHEGLGALKTIQAYNGQPAEMVRFDAESIAHETTLVKAAWARGAVPAVMEILAAASIGILLGYAALTSISAPDKLVTLLMCVGLIAQPAKELGRATQFFIQAQESARRLRQVLELPTHEWPGKSRISGFQKEIRFEKIGFSYDAKKSVLKDVSGVVSRGQTTAIVGPSGAGKSTIVSLLLGFHRATQGRILLDGIDIQDIEIRNLRQQFSWISQEPLIFSTSILENIRLGVPHAPIEEVRKVSSWVLLDDFVMSLPLGYETQVGERGHSLSGGQKQRIALARAMLQNTPILLLDEPTSNLDSMSELEVMQSIRAVAGRKTLLLVSHRLSSVMDADHIVVMAEGSVAESGTHADLLAQKGMYAHLWSLQNTKVKNEIPT